MKRFLALMLAAVMLFTCGAAAAAGDGQPGGDQVTMEEIRELNGGSDDGALFQDGRLTFLDGTCTREPVLDMESALRVVGSLTGLMGGDVRTHFEPWRTLHDSFGNVYYVCQQTYDDLTVQGGAAKVITDPEGNMIGFTGSLVSDLPDVEESEGITAAEAEAVVTEHETRVRHIEPEIVDGMTGRIVLPVDTEQAIEEQTEGPARFVWAVYTVNPGGSVSAGSDYPYLAHYVTMSGEYLYSLPTVLPGDRAATTGYDAEYAFRYMEPAEYTGYVDFSDGSEHEISVTLMRDTRTGTYYLGNIEHRIVVADCWEFLYNHGNVVMESSPDNLEWDQVCLLSLYNYCRAADYYRAVGWEGGDGQGTPIIVLKDYCDKNRMPIDNAAYAGNYFGWLCFLSSSINDLAQCLDVCAHEFTHCVTDSLMTYNAYLNDCGAINEAVSDIQGNLCEMLMGATDDTAWNLGENGSNPVRSMSDPHQFNQPEYSWDIYYQPNVKSPTDVNDRGGVHTNSSLLNNLAYRLCTEGGMTLEEARAYWFAADCAMVPATDYPQLKTLLPWVLKITGMDAYQDALEQAIRATRLGDNALPETLDADQALLTLELPDTERFNDGNWMLGVLGINWDKLEKLLSSLSEKVIRGETDDLPKALRDALEKKSAAPVQEEPAEKKGFFGTFLEELAKSLEKENGAKDSEPAKDSGPELSKEDEEEMAAWLKENFGDVFFTTSGSAGQDGHTVLMMCLPGRTLPYLVYLVMEPNSMEMRQMNFLIYLNGHWVDLTKLFEGFRPGGKLDLKAGLFENGLFLDCLAILFSPDRMGALTLDVKGGKPFQIPVTGLESLDLSGNMAFNLIPEAVEVITRKSRPKPAAEGE